MKSSILAILYYSLLLLALHNSITSTSAQDTQDGWISYSFGQDPAKTKIASIKQNRLTGLNPPSETVNVIATNANMRVKSEIESDKSVLPGQCVSDVEQPYGWNTFRNEMLGSVTRSGNAKGLTLRIEPRVGYTTRLTETITCTLTKPPGEESLFATTPTEQDKTFSFTITAGEGNSLNLVKPFSRDPARRAELQFDAYPLLPANTQSAPLAGSNDVAEGDIRQQGLNIDLLLGGDYWLESKYKELAQFVKCRSITDNDKTGPDCLQGIVKPHHLTWDSDFPSVVALRVPREELRNFNINEISIIYIDIPAPYTDYTSRLPITLGRTAGFLVFTIPVRGSNDPSNLPPSSPAVRMMDFVSLNMLEQETSGIRYIVSFSALSPSQSPNNTKYVTEDCFRGLVNDTDACPRGFVFLIYSLENPPTHNFVRGIPHQKQDLQKYGFTSSRGFPFGDFNWVREFFSNNLASSGTNMQGLVWMNDFLEYETPVNDEITVNLPFSLFNRYEPMKPDPETYPLKIIITPSRGSLVGNLNDINQSQIWFTNVTMCLKLSGESFKPEVATNLISARSRGSISYGWDQQKNVLMSKPGGRVFFSNFSSGYVDYTTLCFTLGRNPDYEMIGGQQETITFEINDTLIQSTGLGLDIKTQPTFTIFGSPGEYTLVAPDTVEEATILVGGFKLRLELAGQKFLPDLTSCALALCQAWNSSSRGVDTDGFLSRSGVICDPSTSFNRIDDRTLELTFAPSATYNTLRGETITTLIPTECTGGVIPVGRPTFTILPQNGNMSFELSFDGGQSLQYADETIEANIRSARCRMYVKIFNDTWDSSNSNLTSELFDAFVSQQSEAYGWNNKKADLIESITILNSSHIQILFRITTTYDITGNETLELPISPQWVNSKRAPQNPTMEFKILASAGDVTLLRWLGSEENRDVTEDDIRWGRLWFEFALSGDQWRRDVNPFMRSFTSSQPNNPTSVHKLIPQLVPSIRFFKFTVDTSTGAEILNLRLQSSALYDISQDENVTLSFDPETVASGIAPFFFVNNQQRPAFWFFVRKTPGRVLMSGEIHTLDEKKMRQSLELKIYLTLIGETWKTGTFKDNTTASIVEFFNAVRDPFVKDQATAPPLQQNGFVAFKTSIIPKTRVSYPRSNILLLHFIPNRNYEIEGNEYVEALTPSWTVASNLQPFTRQLLERLVVQVVPTGGELRLLPEGLVLEESQLRDSNFTVLIAVDGDRWSQNTLLDQSVSFVASAFGSFSSPIKESKGFSALKEEFLNIGNGRRPFLSSGSFSGRETLQVRLNPVSEYDINADETILFSVIDAAFLTTGFLPEPNRVQIPVKAAPRVIVLVIEQVESKAIAYRTNLLRLKNEILRIMGVPVDRQNLVLNQTAIRADGMLAVLLDFLPATSAAQRETDPRSMIELSDTFLSIHTDYLYRQTAIRFAFRQDQAPPDSELVVTPPPTTADRGNQNDGFDYSFVFGIVGGVFIVLMGLGFVIFLRLQRATVSTSALKSSRQRRRDVGATKFYDEDVARRETAIELSINPRLRNAGARLESKDKKQQKHWDPDEDLNIVPEEPMSLRDHVRRNLGIKDPQAHVQQMKKDRWEREFKAKLKQEQEENRNRRLKNDDPAEEQEANIQRKYDSDLLAAQYYQDADILKGRYYTSASGSYSPTRKNMNNRGRGGAAAASSASSPNSTTAVSPLQSPKDSKFEAPSTGTKKFKITNRSDLKRLERLMAI